MNKQQSLPFDKQEYAAMCIGIESFPLPELSAANGRKVRDFLKRVFKGEYYDQKGGRMRQISAPDGTVTCRQHDLAQMIGVSKPTVERYIRYATAAGAIERTTDTDELGRRRTTITFCRHRVMGPNHHESGPNHHDDGLQTITNQDQTITNQDQTITNGRPNHHDDGLHTIGTRTRTTTTSKKQQQQERRPSSSVTFREVESMLTARGVEFPRKCIRESKAIGVTAAEMAATIRENPTASAQSLGRHFIYGSPLKSPRRQRRRARPSRDELEETIVFRGRRRGKTEDEIAHELRAALAAAMTEEV